jgi:MFS family permease
MKTVPNGYPEHNLVLFSFLQEHVQKVIANINLVTMAAQSIPPLFVTMFMGSWTDLYGRKPAILLAFSGYIVTVSSKIAECI